MYYLLIPSKYPTGYFNLYAIQGDTSYGVGRTLPSSHGQCTFSDIREMANLTFAYGWENSPEGVARLLNREHYRFNTYPDVVNLYQTHPEIFL